MQLNKKKELAARVLKVGKDRVLFNIKRLDEIKEAITRQDIKDLVNDKAIILKEKIGKRKKVKRKTRKREGSIKKKVNTSKRDYIIITRKLRSFVSKLKKKEVLNSEEYFKLRKEIRAKAFRSKVHMKERISQLLKERKK